MLCLLFFFGTIPGITGKEASYPASLTKDETAWLKAHPVIRLAPDPEFKPIEFFDQNGNYAGLAADYTRLLEQKLGIGFEIVRCKNWEGQPGTCDAQRDKDRHGIRLWLCRSDP